MAINPSNKRAERAILDALQTRLAVRMRNDVGRVIGGQIRSVADAVADDKEDALGIIVDGAELLSAAFNKSYNSTINTFGSRLLSEAKCIHGNDWVRKNTLQEQVGELVRRYTLTTTAQRVVQVNTTTIDQISAIIQAGRDELLDPGKIATNIRQLAQITTRIRAETIARTETHSAAGFANNEAAKLLDIELWKEWIDAGDEREREDHRAGNVDRVDVNSEFFVGGEYLAYPGDTRGSAENVINCRCASVFVSK
jgi:uncharacterized protein with gpF-like domain